MRRLAALAVGLAVIGLPVGVAAQQQVQAGTGAVLRGIDKISGEVRDFEMDNASAAELGSLRIELGECRYPQGDPAADAFVFLTIHHEEGSQPIFSGWMMASSPALNALEHPRYDVWVLRCTRDGAGYAPCAPSSGPRSIAKKSAGDVTASSNCRRYSLRAISTAPRLSRCSVVNCVSKS